MGQSKKQEQTKVCDNCGEEYCPGAEGYYDSDCCYECDSDPDDRQAVDDYLFYNQEDC